MFITSDPNYKFQNSILLIKCSSSDELISTFCENCLIFSIDIIRQYTRVIFISRDCTVVNKNNKQTSTNRCTIYLVYVKTDKYIFIQYNQFFLKLKFLSVTLPSLKLYKNSCECSSHDIELHISSFHNLNPWKELTWYNSITKNWFIVCGQCRSDTVEKCFTMRTFSVRSVFALKTRHVLK